MMPDPDAVAWLEDPDRLAHQRAAQPGGGHVCDDQCRPTPTPEGLAFLGKLLFTPRQASKLAEIEEQMAAYRIATLDPVKRPTPTRRRRWWWLW